MPNVERADYKVSPTRRLRRARRANLNHPAIGESFEKQFAVALGFGDGQVHFVGSALVSDVEAAENTGLGRSSIRIEMLGRKRVSFSEWHALSLPLGQESFKAGPAAWRAVPSSCANIGSTDYRASRFRHDCRKMKRSPLPAACFSRRSFLCRTRMQSRAAELRFSTNLPQRICRHQTGSWRDDRSPMARHRPKSRPRKKGSWRDNKHPLRSFGR